MTLQSGSSVTGNTAPRGGGIQNEGAAILQAGSSVTGNTATGLPGVFGGGIFNQGVLTLPATGIVTGNIPDNCAGISPLSRHLWLGGEPARGAVPLAGIIPVAARGRNNRGGVNDLRHVSAPVAVAVTRGEFAGCPRSHAAVPDRHLAPAVTGAVRGHGGVPAAARPDLPPRTGGARGWPLPRFVAAAASLVQNAPDDGG